jgi:lipopolysaccharide heptosyltransferase III
VKRAGTSGARRVLIYRLGSLGDTVVALPCFHLIARTFFDAERRLLTNVPISTKAAAPASVLGGTGLVHSFMSYPVGMRNWVSLQRLSATIRGWKPDVVVYLAEPRGLVGSVRDAYFFRASGVKKIVGIPWRRDHRRHRWIAQSGFYEPEAARLARCLKELGDARLDDPKSWDLRLSRNERTRVQELLREWPGRQSFIVCCVGTKVDVKDWGVANWQALLARLGKDYPSIGLVLVGASEEAAKSTEAAVKWRGPVINLCGLTTPRETAALLESAKLFVGHDSGPMHLAAAVESRCVAVFSARQPPRIWFPHGDNHRIIYHHVPCEGCELERCSEFKKICIKSVDVKEVHEATTQLLSGTNAKGQLAQLS